MQASTLIGLPVDLHPSPSKDDTPDDEHPTRVKFRRLKSRSRSRNPTQQEQGYTPWTITTSKQRTPARSNASFTPMLRRAIQRCSAAADPLPDATDPRRWPADQCLYRWLPRGAARGPAPRHHAYLCGVTGRRYVSERIRDKRQRRYGAVLADPRRPEEGARSLVGGGDVFLVRITDEMLTGVKMPAGLAVVDGVIEAKLRLGRDRWKTPTKPCRAPSHLARSMPTSPHLMVSSACAKPASRPLSGSAPSIAISVQPTLVRSA